MVGRARTRAREAELATLEPLAAADRTAMAVRPVPRNEHLASYGMASLRDCVELARHETVANMRTLAEIRDGEAPPMVRLAAACALLDRAYGRPHQSIAVADVSDRGKLDLSAFSPDELRQFESLLSKATKPIDVTPASRGVLPADD